MKRIFILGTILIMISSLAFAESKAPIDSTYKTYGLKIGSHKVAVVTPLDEKRSVLIAIQEEGQSRPDSYLAEGIIALAISRLAKITAAEETDKNMNKYVKKMVEARVLALNVDSGKKHLE